MTLTDTYKIDEQQLVATCIDGERIAQRQLYDTYVDFMMITCLRYIPNQEDAKEVMMDGFCNGYKNLEKFEYRGEGSFKSMAKENNDQSMLNVLKKARRPVKNI